MINEICYRSRQAIILLSEREPRAKERRVHLADSTDAVRSCNLGVKHETKNPKSIKSKRTQSWCCNFRLALWDEIKCFQWHLKGWESVSGSPAVLLDLFYSPIAACRKSFVENTFGFCFSVPVEWAGGLQCGRGACRLHHSSSETTPCCAAWAM